MVWAAWSRLVYYRHLEELWEENPKPNMKDLCEAVQG